MYHISTYKSTENNTTVASGEGNLKDSEEAEIIQRHSVHVQGIPSSVAENQPLKNTKR